MKLKLVVVDLELSKRAKRVMAAALVPVFVVAGGAVAYANVLHVWAQGDTLNASDLNSNFAGLDGRVTTLEKTPAPVTVTAWTPYTVNVTVGGVPITTTPSGSSSTTGSWRRVGDTLEVDIDTSFPTCQVLGELAWSLPTGIVVDGSKLPGQYPIVGVGFAWNNGTNTNSTTTVVPVLGGQVVKLNHPTHSGALDCNAIGTGGDARLSFAVPVQGWTPNN
jgi:hypothetical protein